MHKNILLGIDVEDPRQHAEGGELYLDRVPGLVQQLLYFLEQRRARATFFVVGEVARRCPDVVRTIAEAGHELGCHSDGHVPLDRQSPAEFRTDTLRALEALHACGVGDVAGYRAPCFSLTRATGWAHSILADLGFRYSSSVLPAHSPLHGWPGFGRNPKRMCSGLWEVPVTLLPRPLPPLPIGGVYLRALPNWAVRLALRVHRRSGSPAVVYFHPYDADPGQERFAQSGFRRGGVYHRLMYLNRDRLFSRLEAAEQLGFRFAPIGSFVEALERGTSR